MKASDSLWTKEKSMSDLTPRLLTMVGLLSILPAAGCSQASAGSDAGPLGQDASPSTAEVAVVPQNDALPGSTIEAGRAFFDPLAPENIAQAFSTARSWATGSQASPQVDFMELLGTPSGEGTSYENIPFVWTYTFESCDGAQPPCSNALAITVVHPGWSAANVNLIPSGLSTSEATFLSNVPLTFAGLLAKRGLSQTDCPMLPASAGPGSIDLRGGTKQGSGKPLWFWVFTCSNSSAVPFFSNTNGDPIT
jgi:hypothetical protein